MFKNRLIHIFKFIYSDGLEQLVRVWMYKNKNNIFHNFIIDDPDWIALFIEYKKETEYLWNNPKSRYGSRVFWRSKIKDGKEIFHGQPLGKDWFYSYPKDIAKWLNKPNWNKYSGHSICRFGSTVYADSGASLLKLKKFGGWKSNKVAEEYYANSKANKLETARTISQCMNLNDKDMDNHNHNHNQKDSHNHNQRKRKFVFNDGKSTKRHKQSQYIFNNCTFTECEFVNNVNDELE